MYDRNAYPASLWEVMATTSMLGRLKYTADEIFVAFHEGDVFVHLHAEGKVGVVRIGKAEFPPEVMKAKLDKLCNEMWNTGGTMTHEEKNEIYFSSKALALSDVILAGLLTKGFTRWLKYKSQKDLLN